MSRKIVVLLVLFVFVVSLSGCAALRKRKGLEAQGLKNQISVLETQLQTKDEEIAGLRESLNNALQEKEALSKEVSKKKMVGEVKSRPKAKDIQIALKNASYNPGPIDGKMGRQTRDAIRAFQRANNLAVDGKVGKQTRRLLKEYLYKKVK